MTPSQTQDPKENLKTVLEPIKSLVVVGANWGDEGKGKVIDKVLEYYDIATRFSGGANAGHTVFTPEGKKLVSHLIPCGLAQNKVCVLGRGEFFNLELFLKELEESKQVLQGPLPKIYIDEQAPLWTPYHKFFEMYIEFSRGAAKIGTTNKGIGPLEGLYKLRLAPVVGHLFEPEIFKTGLESMFNVLKPCFAELEASGQLNEKIPAPEEIINNFSGLSAQIKDLVADTSFLLYENLKQNKRVLFEGAQATGLDAWWGTYPYVSSGNSVAAGAALGTGLPMDYFGGSSGATILVAKTLPTRVGFGPFPSEMWDRQEAMNFAKEHGGLYQKGEQREKFLKEFLEKINSGQASNIEMSQYFQVLGDERGATTGRGRSLGFLDIPWLAYAVRVNNPKWLALTRFDMLSKIKSVPVVVGYKYQGKTMPLGQLPPSWHLAEVETVLEQWQCWDEDISGTQDFEKLPQGAKEFILQLERRVGIPILLVGTGPGREAVIVRTGQSS